MTIDNCSTGGNNVDCTHCYKQKCDVNMAANYQLDSSPLTTVCLETAVGGNDFYSTISDYCTEVGTQDIEYDIAVADYELCGTAGSPASCNSQENCCKAKCNDDAYMNTCEVRFLSLSTN